MQDLKKIVEHHIEGKRFEEYLKSNAFKLIDYLEDKKEETVTKFEKLIEWYNIENIENFSEELEPNFEIALFKTMGEYSLVPCVDYDGAIGEFNKEFGEITEELNIFFTEPDYDSVEGEYYFGAENEHLKANIFFTWLCLIWQEIDGNRTGLKFKTLENNSATSFYFTDFAWDDWSVCSRGEPYDLPLNNLTNKKLSTLEIYQRTDEIYPRNPYKNVWRRFSNGEKINEIVIYDNKTGIRENSTENTDLDIVEHENWRLALQFVHETSISWITKNYREILTHSLGKITPESIEMHYFCGINWFDNEMKHRIDFAEIERFEEEQNISIPFFFKHFLRLTNGRQHNPHHVNFWCNEQYIRMEQFYNFNQIRAEYKSLNNEWLSIGITQDDYFLELNISLNSEYFGFVRKKNLEGLVENLDFTFEDLVQIAS